MKICFLAGTLAHGGAERQLVFMLRAALNRGFSVRVLCLTEGEFFETGIRELGIKIEYLGKQKHQILRLVEILRNLRKNKPDILQSSHFYTNIYVGLAGKILKIPSVGAIRSDLKNELSAHGRLGKAQLKLPHHLVANSELAMQRAIDFGISANKIDFVRNVVEIGNVSPPNRRKSQLKILFVGRLVALKRPEIFVGLAKKMELQLPNFSLDFQLAGDGDLKSELQSLVKSLDLKRNRVTFLGWQNDLREIYGNADVLILTSLFEGTPNVILEAMAHGVSVIAAKVGGVQEILNNERGILVEKHNEAGFADALKQLILNADLRLNLGSAGRAFVEKHHSLSYLENRLAEIYRRLRTRK